ncbi:MAG TPA: mucoidy inhibitor MuiA family protein, partial [Bacteroidaceae bacterium]|nr:mucoidy inhibitor MuiA family protein [Bacteroidaceae bacterium]
MKALTIILILITASTNIIAAPAEKQVDAGIDRVTLFYSGAQIERSSKSFSLETGQAVITVKGLEQDLAENSIRVGLTGNGKILSVVKRMEFLEQTAANQKITDLEKKLQQLDREKEELHLSTKVFDQEKILLVTNMKLGSEQHGVQVQALREASDFYRLRMGEIEKGILNNNRKIKDIDLEISRIKRQLNDLNYQKNKPSSTLELTVELKAAGTVRILMDYYVPAARWVPVYDIRVDEAGEPVSIVRKASAAQSTGVDWTNVSLTFSTGNPRERASKPELNPWYLREIKPEPVMQIRGMAGSAVTPTVKKSEAVMEMAMEEVMDMSYYVQESMPEVAVGARQSLLEFTLASPASIPSDNKEYT